MTSLTRDDRRSSVELFERLAKVSADSVGVTRESYGEGENDAHEIVADAARRAGLEVAKDAAANLVIRLPGRNPEAPAVVCGSHLDSVPQGGNFDGAAGVLAGVQVLRGLRRAGTRPHRDICVYALRGEESAWYGKCYLGSSALFGALSEADLTRMRRDGAGNLAEAMSSCGAAMQKIRRGETLLDPARIAAYLELHIEQGPVL
jgi:N-carbamoyl-L-amino-acid hydrolase